MLWLAVLTVGFLALSGLMAAIDAALLSVTRPEIEELILQGKQGAHRLRQAKLQSTQSVVVIVILTNLINVLGPILVSQKAVQLYGAASLFAVTVVLTLGTILFSEIIPKSLGVHYAPTLGRWAAPGIRGIRLVMLPLVKTLAWLSDAFRRGQRVIGTEDQIRSLVKMGWRSGYIEPDEGHMIHRTFLLNDRTAQEVMTELADTVSIPSDASVEDAVAVVRANKFTRYPVLGQTPDDVLGIVIARDVLQAMLNGQAAESVVSLVQPAFVVDAEARIDDLLVEFRARHQHLAVVQHNQKTVGIVTLENAVEQIVGDIKDETDMTIE